MSGPLILLTGAAGNLGKTVHRTLLEAGHEVRATDIVRTITPTLPLVKANLLRPDACRRVVQGATVLVHLAYRPDLNEHTNGYSFRIFDDHIRMNRHLFEAACKAGVKKIIFSSSIGVIARRLPLTSASQLPRTLPLDENTPPEPDNWYGLAKLCSEEMLAMFRRQYGIDYVNLRFPALVNTVPIPNYEAYKNRLCEGLSYLSIRDAADLILKVIDADVPGGRTYLPASRKNTQGLPVADLIRDRFAGVPLRKPAEEMECLVDISTLKHEIGWESQELSQPEVETRLPLSWRLRKLLLNPVPESLKLFLKRLFVARV